jgi:acyl carrier protein
MSDSVRAWVHTWFVERNPTSAIDDEANFYEAGYVDSFGIIELIDAIESHFAIQFADEDFRLASFRTIVGLSDIIAARAEPAG